MKVCTVCGGRYRGLYPIHAGTARHQAGQNRRNKGNLLGKDDTGSKAARRRRAHHQALRERPVSDLKEHYVLVKKHRRRPPDDGPRKIVPVRRHLRGRPEFEEEPVTLGGLSFIHKRTARHGRTVSIVDADTYARKQGWS